MSESHSRIELLSTSLADQIAAGEVVERPASALKELVDNAVDAGARRIEIDMEEGGRKLLRVLDDGRGIHPDDLQLSILRHATSKIRNVDQLLELSTLGFRGEALASLAAVSVLRIRSRQAQESVGCEMLSRPGDAPVLRKMGMPVGTQVEISGLFATVPARLKFLRAEATEVGHCVDALLRIALVHPEIQFILRNGTRTLLSLSATTWAGRAAQVLGRRARGPFVHIDGESDGISVQGWIAPAQQAIRQPHGQYFAVRRRVVRERNFAQILRRALGDELSGERYAVAFLNVEPPSRSVDVNVHPQKSEVRFSDAQCVYAALRQVLEREWTAHWRGAASRDVPSETSEAPQGNPSHRAEELLARIEHSSEKITRNGAGDSSYRPASNSSTGSTSSHRPVAPSSSPVSRASSPAPGLAALLRSSADVDSRSSAPRYKLSTRASADDYAEQKQRMKAEVDELKSALRAEQELAGRTRDRDVTADSQKDLGLLDTSPVETSKREPDAPREVSTPRPAQAVPSPPEVELPQLLTTLPGPIAIFADAGDLLAVDLRRVRSHLVYRKLADQIGDKGVIAMQGLLRPVVVRPEAADLELCVRHLEDLRKLGLELEAFGDGALLVRGVPAALSDKVSSEQLLELIVRVLPWLRLKSTDASGPDARTLVELAEVSSHQLDAAPRLARRWLAELCVDTPIDAIPGVHRWKGAQLCRKS